MIDVPFVDNISPPWNILLCEWSLDQSKAQLNKKTALSRDADLHHLPLNPKCVCRMSKKLKKCRGPKNVGKPSKN